MKTLEVLVLVVLVIWVSQSVGFGQIDLDDQASREEWIFFATLVAFNTAGLVLLAIVWHRNRNPHTGLLSRVKGGRARGPIRRGRRLN
jgi:hypothetical protein